MGAAGTPGVNTPRVGVSGDGAGRRRVVGTQKLVSVQPDEVGSPPTDYLTLWLVRVLTLGPEL
jgi:hypothetical protein